MTNKDYMKQAPAQTQSRQPGMEQQMHPEPVQPFDYQGA